MVDPFSPRLTNDQPTNQNFQDIRNLATQIIRGALLQNVFIENVTLGPQVSSVSHTLNRRPHGWFIVRKNAEADVWEPRDSASPSKVIDLQASAEVTVDIIFF